VLGRRDLDEPVPIATTEAPRPSRLPILAIALAGVAAVLLVVAVLRRHGATTDNSGPTPGSDRPVGSDGTMAGPIAPARSPLVDDALASMFGAVCRHEVACGIGDLGRCDYVETTMRQMPKSLGLKPCATFDETAAKRCLSELAARSCDDHTKSLAIQDLADALDRVTNCRRACN
jgi:hypothetical protein